MTDDDGRDGSRGALRPFELRGPIETSRLRLRPFEPADFDALFAYQSRDDVTRYLQWGARNRDEVRHALELKIAATAIRAEGDFLALAAESASAGEIVGDVVLGLVSEEHAHGEIGYIVHPDHHGHGYATEMARPLLRIAFEDLGLHRVTGVLDARNAASARVLEKLGMRREANLVENEFLKDEWQSEIVYAILAREWRAAGEG
jgi:RimJ/RimL family protein N-acetyltransferase